MVSYLLGSKTSATEIPATLNAQKILRPHPITRFGRIWWLNYYNNGTTRYSYIAGVNVIDNGDGKIIANQIQANSLSAISANLGGVTAGYMQATNGKMLINLDGSSISFYE